MMRVDRDRRPPLGADPVLRFPEIRRRALSNGLRVWTVEHARFRWSAFSRCCPVGASADPADRPGLAAMTSDMLDEGCGDFDALELHDALGAHRRTSRLGDWIGRDDPDLDESGRHADRASALLADMIIRPRLDAGDFQRVRELRLNRLIQLRDLAPGARRSRFLPVALRRSSLWAHAAWHRTVAAIADARRGRPFSPRMFTPSRMTVIAGTRPRCACRVRRVGVWRLARIVATPR